MLKRVFAFLLVLILCLLPLGSAEVLVEDGFAITEDLTVEYGMDYSTPGEVALYLYVFCELPPNFITKDEAYDLGWNSKKGNLWDVAPEMSIGGDSFGNREGLLPEGKYTECDLYTLGKDERGAERLVFTDDEYYYTGDHYASFTQIWVEDGEVITK